MQELDAFSLPELSELQKNVEREIKRRRSAERAKATSQIREIMATYGLSKEDILSGKIPQASRGVVAPKYANPNKPNETWTGRGRKPLWVVGHLKIGGTLEDLAI